MRVHLPRSGKRPPTLRTRPHFTCARPRPLRTRAPNVAHFQRARRLQIPARPLVMPSRPHCPFQKHTPRVLHPCPSPTHGSRAPTRTAVTRELDGPHTHARHLHMRAPNVHARQSPLSHCPTSRTRGPAGQPRCDSTSLLQARHRARPPARLPATQPAASMSPSTRTS
ncbi:hypothetical protein K438DRAFT_1859688, partial [Mycena galopus ATCC 62051]